MIQIGRLKSKYFILAGLAFLAAAWPLVAQNRPLVLADSAPLTNLVPYTDMLVQGDQNLTVQDLQLPDLRERFVPQSGDTILVEPGVRWLRVRMVVPLAPSTPRFLELGDWMLERATLYRQLPTGMFDSEAISFMTEIRDRSVNSRNFVLRLQPQPGPDGYAAEQIFYLRIESKLTFVRMPVTVGTAGLLLRHQTSETILISCIICSFLVMGIFGCILLAGSREKVWVVFSGLAFISAFILFATTGLSRDFLPAQASKFLLVNYPMIHLLYLFFSLILLLQFLGVKAGQTGIWRMVVLALVLCGLIGLVFLVLPESSLVIVKMPLLIVAIALVSVVRLVIPLLLIWRGQTQARIYLTAFAIEIVGSLIYLGYSTGLLPNNGWTSRAATLGGMLQFLIICYGASVRLRQLTAEIQLGNSRLSILNEELETKVTERTAELERERNKLLHLAMEDELTGLLSRRTILENLECEFQRFRRYGTAFSVMMIDLDHFKQVNDNYGHLTGDRVLRDLATVLHSQLRVADMSGRLGGEEFLVVLPQTHTGKAMHVAEKVRQSLAGIRYTDSHGAIFQVTCSIGVAEVKVDSPDFQSLLHDSDAAMYRAKEAGRNRTAMAF